MAAFSVRKHVFSPLRAMLPARYRHSAPRVKVVRLQGVIGRSSPFAKGLSIENVAPLLERAFADEDAAAVALIINSPGGSPVQSHLIYKRIRALAAEKKLPVIAFCEDVAASGGYMIACAADEIFIDPSSIVGSIGVVSGGFGFSKAIEKIGVERRVYTAGESKATLDPFMPEKPEDVARLQHLQAEIHAHFIALVRESRGGRLVETGEGLFTGAFWVGKTAIALGLADEIGDIRAVLRARFGEKVKLDVMSARRGFSLGRFIGSAAQALPVSALATIEERALWSRFGL